ncbi:MAG: RNA-directed DNA polymerase [Candidatus Melainabacteria bacterium]|nr:MAG: RNA-directed DNA polymerase [Candidatus Melainabacteria bacterium]
MNNSVKSTVDLSKLMAMPPHVLKRFILSRSKAYKVFKIRKKSGKGFRTIAAPNSALKGIQRWINVFILQDIGLHPCSTGFRKGDSILKNAKIHVGSDFVLNIDIKDFFGTVSSREVFRQFRLAGFNKDVADSLAKLTTFHGVLPQGAPTSPLIANLAATKLDRRIFGFCSVRGWKYSRYADDITISGNGHVSKREEDKIFEILRSEGFEPNLAKFRVARRGSSQMVTGLTVNSKVAVPRSYRKRIRAIFYQASIYPEKFQYRLDELNGYISFLRQVDPQSTTLGKYQDIAKRLSNLNI